MAKSVECRCTYNFTCGYCLRNAKPPICIPLSVRESIAIQQDKDRKEGTK